MSLLNDVLRDLDKRNAGQGEGSPDGVPPGLMGRGNQHGHGDGGFGRGQLMKLIVWVLIVLALITAVIVGWRTLDFGRQALDRIPVDENLQAVPRNVPLAGEVKPVEPLPERTTSPEPGVTAGAPAPVVSSQYPLPETASMSGPSPGEPDSSASEVGSSAPGNGPQSAAPAPTVTVVGEREPIAAALPTVETSVPVPKTEQPSAETPAAQAKVPAASLPQEAQGTGERREKPSAATAEMKVTTLAARRLDEARALQAAGQIDAALTLFSRLEPSIATPARAPALFSFKAGLLQQQGRYAEAADLYATLLKLKSADVASNALEARWWRGLAIAQEQLRQPERAHAAWLNALAAGGLSTTTRSYAAGRIAALAKAGIKPDYQTVLDTSGSETNSRQDQP